MPMWSAVARLVPEAWRTRRRGAGCRHPTTIATPTPSSHDAADLGRDLGGDHGSGSTPASPGRARLSPLIFRRTRCSGSRPGPTSHSPETPADEAPDLDVLADLPDQLLARPARPTSCPSSIQRLLEQAVLAEELLAIAASTAFWITSSGRPSICERVWSRTNSRSLLSAASSTSSLTRKRGRWRRCAGRASCRTPGSPRCARRSRSRRSLSARTPSLPLWCHVAEHRAFRRFAVGLGGRGLQPLLAQHVLGLVHVAVEASWSAALQSIIGAPVILRSCHHGLGVDLHHGSGFKSARGCQLGAKLGR